MKTFTHKFLKGKELEDRQYQSNISKVCLDSNKYFLYANLNSKWNLAEVNRFFQDSPFLNLNGIVEASTKYKGYLSFNKMFKYYFMNSEHQTEAEFQNTSFNYVNSPLNYNVLSLNCLIKNNLTKINSSSINISNSDFGYVGRVENFLPYIMGEGAKLHIKGNINSTTTIFNELMEIKKYSKKNTENTLPNNIILELNTYFSKFIYNKFVAYNLNGKIKYDEIIK